MNMATDHLNTSPLTQLLQRQRSSYFANRTPITLREWSN